MKKPKMRIDARLNPNTIWDIDQMAIYFYTTRTEAIQRCLEKGLEWYRKKASREISGETDMDWNQISYEKIGEYDLGERTIETYKIKRSAEKRGSKAPKDK